MREVNLPFYIARRYLLAKKSQNAINIISTISVLGVAVGTMALVVVLSVFNGFDKVVKSLFNAFDPDIKITATVGKTFSPSGEAFDRIRNHSGVAAYSEVLEENALLMYGDQQHIATIKGADSVFVEVTGIDSMMVDGSMTLKDQNRPYAVVGQGVAYYLRIGLSFVDPLFVYTIRRSSKVNLANPDESVKRRYIYPSGIFAIEQDFDSRYVIVPIEFARELLEYSDEVSAIEVKLNPGKNPEQTQADFKNILGPDYRVKNREEQNELFYRIMRSEKYAIFLILTFILVIASFNIVGSLSMLIIDKKRDIKSLRDMGAGNKLIERIFIAEGWMISLIGSLIGLVAGTGISWVQDRFGLLKLQGSGTFVIDAYPVDIQIPDLILVWLTVLFIGFLAALYPVKQISKKYLRHIENSVIV
ncbi:MAG: ABC transporter permease [Bacteroidales bacterium]|nr:ABC transporter permease [Bacteroidales bacterium]MBN2698560.1 ABC transporter permease [Bacteroidales bacterium]